MRCARHYDRAAQARSLGYFVEEGTEHGGRANDLREDVRWHSESFQEVDSPRLRARVVALGRGRVRPLADRDAAEPVVEEVGHEEQGLGVFERALVRADGRVELDERVDRHELDAGPLVHLPRRHLGEEGFERAFGAAVAMVNRVPEEPPVPIEEAVVDPPGVDADRVHRCRAAGRDPSPSRTSS